MSLLSLLFPQKQKSAATAKERLQIIIARERGARQSGYDFLPELHKELIEVISKYTKVNPDGIKINLDRQGNLEVLEVNVVLPDNEPAEQQ